jgi:iron uptake system component EfeO
MGTSRLRAMQLAAVGAALAAGLAACGSGGGPGGGQSNVITVSSSKCGGAWSVSGPGWHTLQISNQGTGGAEIDLVNPANGAVYAEIENSGPATVNPISIDLGSGRCALLCLFSDYGPLLGSTVTVGGHAAGTPAVLPVTYDDLIPLAKKYAAEEESAIKVLASQTATLAAAVRHGNLATARRDWLTAHRQYETLGDAYDAFGNFDSEIDGRADPVGVTSPKWTGFFRLEYGLWHGQSLASLAPVANALNGYVGQLATWWPTQEVPLADLGRRAHEVIENALEFQLTGHDELEAGRPEPEPGRPGPGRRSFLRGAAGGVVAGGIGGYAYRGSPAADPAAAANAAVVQGRLAAVPFHGKYQAGILPAPSRATAVAAATSWYG